MPSDFLCHFFVCCHNLWIYLWFYSPCICCYRTEHKHRKRSKKSSVEEPRAAESETVNEKDHRKHRSKSLDLDVVGEVNDRKHRSKHHKAKKRATVPPEEPNPVLPQSDLVSESGASKYQHENAKPKRHSSRTPQSRSNTSLSPSRWNFESNNQTEESDLDSSTAGDCAKSCKSRELTNTTAEPNTDKPSNEPRGSQSGFTLDRGANSMFYLDYSRNNVEHEEPSKKKHRFKDIRKHLRYYAKTKLTEKYLGQEKKYKKHDKGHKHSSHWQSFCKILLRVNFAAKIDSKHRSDGCFQP